MASASLAMVAAAAGPVLAAEVLTIQHHPAHCLVAGKYPQLDACFDPPSRVARARVYFRGEGAPDWYYVEMKAEAACFRGLLPRPKKSLKRISYYVAVTDPDFAEARTEEYATDVVPDEKSCPGGVVAPFVTSASVVVGGAAVLPAGFLGGGVLAGVSTTAVAAGAAVVGAGAAGAVIVGGGEPSTTTTVATTTTTSTTLATTTTTTSTTSTTTTTTTTMLPGGCAADSAPPVVQILGPTDGADVGARIDVEVQASDPGPVTHGIREVRIYADEQGGSRTASIATLAGPGPTFRASWTLPSCRGPQDRWYVFAEAVDGCDRTALDRARVRRRSDSCSAALASSARGEAGPDAAGPALVWTSELALPGGRGQVIANGSDVVFPGPGWSNLTLPARPGRNRIEAVLVEGARPGGWRFTLAAGAIHPGSLRVLAGEAVALGAQTVAFRLQGRPGERVVFEFDAG